MNASQNTLFTSLNQMVKSKHLACFLLASSLFLSACPKIASPQQEELYTGFDIPSLLVSLFDDVIYPRNEKFMQEAAVLQSAVAEFSEQVAAGNEALVEKETAQNAFSNAMNAWQQIEVMQLGPQLLPVNDAVQAEGLRDEIYSWPLVNPCEIDRQVVNETYTDPAFIEQKRVNVYGLDALEYLLFNEDNNNACPGPASINADGSWASLTPAEIRKRRAQYAQKAADALSAQANLIAEKLSQSYRTHFVEAGTSSSDFSSPAQALQALFDSLFYLEVFTQNQKLGIPVGLNENCTQETCASDVELGLSQLSLSAVLANVLAFEAIFEGGAAENSQGLFTLLEHLGEEQARDALREKIQAAKSKLNALQEDNISLPLLIENDLESARELFTLIKAIVDELSGNITSALFLEIPTESGADTD